MAEAARSLGWTDKRIQHLTYRGMADLRLCLSRKGLQP
jgi:RNA polymerase sigma-70 factor (ECF subfamily)